MGFGSYDESEQQNQELNTDDDTEGINVHENDHEGELTFESQVSTDDLVGRLKTMKPSTSDE